MTDDGITFCIPNWNHRSFLPRSIGSALRAMRRLRDCSVESQLLVIDDQSRDGSQRALLALTMMADDARIDVFCRRKNKGLAAGRNLGLARAAHPYVCFLDADNEICPDNLPIFVRAIRQTKAAVVYGNLVKHDGHRSMGLLSNDYIHDGFYTENYVDAFALCDRRRLLARGGYDETLTSHEDWEMYLHLLAEDEQIVFVPAVMGYYYVNHHSMVQSKDFEHAQFHRIFNQRMLGLPLHARERKMFHPDIGWL